MLMTYQVCKYICYIISYAQDKGLGVIPCINSPGHMDIIVC